MHVISFKTRLFHTTVVSVHATESICAANGEFGADCGTQELRFGSRFAFRQQYSHSQTAVGDAGSGACTMWPPSRRSRRCQRRDVACRDWEGVAWRGWPQLGTIILYVFINYMFLIIFLVLLLLATCAAAKFSLVVLVPCCRGQEM